MNRCIPTGRIFELSNERQITGRRKIKVVLHEIFSNHDEWQENGISWDETYSRRLTPFLICLCVLNLSAKTGRYHMGMD